MQKKQTKKKYTYCGSPRSYLALHCPDLDK